jgi:hypothetical protein
MPHLRTEPGLRRQHDRLVRARQRGAAARPAEQFGDDVVQGEHAKSVQVDDVLLVDQTLMEGHGRRAVRGPVVVDEHVYPARVGGGAAEQPRGRVARERRSAADLEQRGGRSGSQIQQSGPVDEDVPAVVYQPAFRHQLAQHEPSQVGTQLVAAMGTVQPGRQFDHVLTVPVDEEPVRRPRRICGQPPLLWTTRQPCRSGDSRVPSGGLAGSEPGTRGF